MCQPMRCMLCISYSPTHSSPATQSPSSGCLVLGGAAARQNASITSLSLELSAVASKYKLCLPPYFTLILRAFSTVEGIAIEVGCVGCAVTAASCAQWNVLIVDALMSAASVAMAM